MAARPTLAAQPRTVLGKQVSSLRRQGKTPGVIFGRGIDSIPVQVSSRELENLMLRGGLTSLIDLTVDGGNRVVLIKDFARDPVRGSILHVNFQAVRMTEAINTEVPIVITGEAPAVKNHRSMVLRGASTLQISCLPSDLPSEIVVDISGLTEPNQIIHAGDVQLPHGVTLLTDPTEMIVRTEQPRVVEEVPEAAPVEEAPAAEAAPAEAEAESEGES